MLHPREADAPAFVDYLAFTIKGAKRLLSRVPRHADAPDGLETLRAALWGIADDTWTSDRDRVRAAALWADLPEPLPVDCTGHAAMKTLTGRRVELGLYLLARTMIEAVGPALMVDELCGKGLNGYSDHAKIRTHLGENCGSIAVGGNRDTVHVILTGQACRRLDMHKLADALDGFDVRISRIDSAWDDFSGRFGTPRDAATKYADGGFQPERGTRSASVQLVDDLGSGKGSTFYLGDRKTRLLRVYSKGQQLGDPESPWTRYEIQWMGSAFDLSTDNLRAPGALLARYPDLGHLPVCSDGTGAHRTQREAEISAARTAKWIKTTCGAAIGLAADAIGPELFVELVRREEDAVPRRLRGIADTRADVSARVGGALLEQCRHAPAASLPSFERAWDKCNEQDDSSGGSGIRLRGRAVRREREGQALHDSRAGMLVLPRVEVSRESPAFAG
ncbi:replication initiation factor domain-containing protein [Lysobacter sp. GX 14042]|uniref:replication initiation factor domain-containing protein n=1 Tax=Lysobacter sp. GX 14042 TaxID=2907155 RepID=UPI001F18DDC1|nr:replication initiation factor domain-containing protein [Lysobacter sp. GX 14042]MCE7031356.1 replication initiation factor domain-containing protein [Lysobacter sp. GX 14042]